MKAKYIALILVIIAMLAVFFSKKHEVTKSLNQKIALQANQTNIVKNQTKTVSNTFPVIPDYGDKILTPAEIADMREKREKQRKILEEQVLNEWRTPIEFYGIVEDESNNVIASAKVDFDCNDLSSQGTSFYHTQSDGNGLFSITGITGKILGVYVNKEGYYSYHPHGDNFEYGDKYARFMPDANHPVVFRLRKKGEAADLIHYDRSFQFLTDGTPILIDLPTGKTTTSSQNAIRVEAWIYEKIDRWKFNWKCRVSVPGGGLQIYDEEFPFLAPEENYVPEEIIDMPVTNNPSWSNQARRNYYIRTADGKFGRMVFTMVPAGDHFCELNLYFNSDGSRNLEPR